MKTKPLFANVMLVTFFCFSFSVDSAFSQDALIWQKYTGVISNPNIPLLPDYSYAGYMRGEVGIPDVNHQVFDVTDPAYGAIPDDGLSDKAAIQAAIDAAEANGSGVVFFPPGEYTVNTVVLNNQPITINSSNIVLRGSGSAYGGTVINMLNHMDTTNGSQSRALFNFSQVSGLNNKTSLGVGTANRGDQVVTVANADRFVGVKYCRIFMDATTVANSDFLEGRPTKVIWTQINNGVLLDETHEIDSLDLVNNKIYLKDPLIDTFKATYNWKVRTNYLLENCGFEDIHIKGNFLDQFVHHKNNYHDYGWNGVDLRNVAHSWVRRCRFTNVTMGAKITARSYASSILNILVDGNAGHALTQAGYRSSRILQGLIWDNTNNGQFHGADMSGGVAGSVVWRVDARKGKGFDLHASMPRTNLIDLYVQVETDNVGGNYKNLPHHLTGLTMWNIEQVGTQNQTLDFWNLCSGNYCGLTVVNPMVVGYHGAANTNFINTKYEESNGTKVSPESLFEAQLIERTDSVPSWIAEAINEWEGLKQDWYFTPVIHNYVETFNNLTLVGWGNDITYEGDHGFTWTVSGKGESGRIDSTKNIYMRSGKVGAKSDLIQGGIRNFKVTCKNLWHTENERKIKLLINGNEVDSLVHTGTDIYDFSVNNINVPGDFTIAIKNASDTSDNNSIAMDNIEWSSYSPPPSYFDYIETFNNLTLVGWGNDITYEGDHGFMWTVNGKGESGRIDGTKNIYMRSGKVGASATINGGIGNFMVTCKNLWDTGNERKIRLLIDGEPEDSLYYSEEGLYTFEVYGINKPGGVTIAIENASDISVNNSIAIDNISWTSYSNSNARHKQQSEVSTVLNVAVEQFRTYPNPMKDRLVITGIPERANLELLDASGRQIKLLNMENQSGNDLQLDVSGLQPGIYLMNIKSSDYYYTFRLIKE
ncbi:DUF4955 domain-containing protein [Fulvivirga sp. M361]|uniref:DUF4955 domain-containing protein n=1 Tax=Fulvivirga sp. M361 TaxID=2594266 RepID=UPI00117B1B57|nr:DUF4955 domain-containing protein [Fulvivirga sp. M361]TRX49039.1 DUF4955 domain-containing protein [Fulvivirga sp. M361]